MIKISRSNFLKQRKEALEEWNRIAKNDPDESVVIVDAGEEVICDACNVEIVADELILDQGSESIYCPQCAVRWMAL